jgi:PRC-barrel domain
MQTYYDFKSGNGLELHAFTDTPTTDKLPPENGPWTLVGQVSSGDKWTFSVNRGVVAAGVLENGFYLCGTSGQTPSPNPLINSDRVEGTEVYDPAGKNIGTIKRLVIEKVSGRVVYAVMTFGGFLGIGEHTHTIPWDKLTFDIHLGGYRTDISEEELHGAPVHNESKRGSERELHDYWRVPPYWGT